MATLRGVYYVLLLASIGLVTGIEVFSDTIYLTNQSIIVSSRAWVEGDEVKYETAQGVKTVPKGQVLKITNAEPVILPKYGFSSEARRTEAGPKSDNKPVRLPLLTSSKPDVTAETLQRLKENLQAEPDNERRRNELVGALNGNAARQIARGDYTDAVASLRSALSYNPADVPTLINLASIQYQTGEYRSAEETLTKAESFTRNNQYLHYLLGEVYYAQDKLDQATREWTEALRISGDEKINDLIKKGLKKASREVDTHKSLGQITSAHFILRYDHQVADYSLGQEMLNQLEKLYANLAFRLFNAPPQTIAVILYPDEAFFDVTRAPSWSGALYDGKIRVPTKGLTQVTDQLNSILVHELTHSFIALATRNDCPTWFNEGVAQFMEGRRSRRANGSVLAALQKGGRLIPLSSLAGSFVPFPGELAALAYAESLSAVEFLVHVGGDVSVLKKILGSLSANGTFESALKAHLNTSLADFEKAWMDYVASEYR
jgi:tetratricopeptide (TPR) repeat protein